MFAATNRLFYTMYIRPPELPPVVDFLRRHEVDVPLLIEMLETYRERNPAEHFDHYERPDTYIDATTYLDKITDFLELLIIESVPRKM